MEYLRRHLVVLSSTGSSSNLQTASVNVSFPVPQQTSSDRDPHLESLENYQLALACSIGCVTLLCLRLLNKLQLLPHRPLTVVMGT